MRNLDNLDAYRHGCDLAVVVYRLSRMRPLRHDAGLVDQLRRAAVSTPSNIAEAFALGTNRQLIRCLRIALSSAMELETQLRIASRADMLPDHPLATTIEAEADREVSMIIGLLKRYGARIPSG